MFHIEIQNDHEAIAKEEHQYRETPIVTKVVAQEIQDNYDLIKSEGLHIIRTELKAIKVEQDVNAYESRSEVKWEEKNSPNSI